MKKKVKEPLEDKDLMEKVKMPLKAKCDKKQKRTIDTDFLTVAKGANIKRIARQITKLKGIETVGIADIIEHDCENAIEDQCLIVTFDKRFTFNGFEPPFWICASHKFPTVNSVGGVLAYDSGEIDVVERPKTDKEAKAALRAMEYVPVVQITPTMDGYQAKVIWGGEKPLDKPATFGAVFDKNDLGSKASIAFKKMVEDGRFFSDIKTSTDDKGKSFIDAKPAARGSEIIPLLKKSGYLAGTVRRPNTQRDLTKKLKVRKKSKKKY